MWPLEPLTSDADDDKALAKILQKDVFKDHAAAWTAAYQDYRTLRGDPWQVGEAGFDAETKEQQYALYDKRKNGGPLKRIRQRTGILCCPLCGSPSIGSLDHYLPRGTYPEFSVLPANLLPACFLCNSGAKGTTYKGDAAPQRFLHPYFDTLANDPVWMVVAEPPYAAPTFDPAPANNIAEEHLPLLRFHLANILGTAFATAMATMWSNMPISIAALMRDLEKDGPGALQTEYDWACRTSGKNGWHAALLRGVLASPDASDYIVAAAGKVMAPAAQE